MNTKTFKHRKTGYYLFSVILLIVFSSSGVFGQDALYSQYYNNPVYYNPAYTGSNIGMRARLNYRNQWHQLDNDYNNYTLTVDAALPALPGAGGLGIVFGNDFDGFGSIRTTNATLTASSKISLSDDFYAMFGMNVSFVQKSLDWNDFVFSNEIEVESGQYRIINGATPTKPVENKNFTDFGSGLLFRYCESGANIESIIGTLGISVQHMFEPDISFYDEGIGLPLKLVISGDMLFDNETGVGGSGRFGKKNQKYKINPGFQYEKQGSMSNFAIGVNGYKNYIYAGIWFRTQNFNLTNVNDMIIMGGIKIPVGINYIKLFYSYDYVLTDLRRAVGATHEISLVYDLSRFDILGSSGSKNGGRIGSNRKNKMCTECSPF